MVWLVPLLPVLAGPVLWAACRRRSRATTGAAGAAVLFTTLVAAAVAAVTAATGRYEVTPDLELLVATPPVAGLVAIVVPAVALPITVAAASSAPAAGRARLVGLLCTFVGAMQLLVLADDLLTLLVGWELVGALSATLIAHEWRRPETGRAGVQAFTATRVGDLGLFIAAGAALAGSGSLHYADLGELSGDALAVVAAGVLLAAVAKSAQLPFAPWLSAAMAGPTPVSALLHAATMVAAGAYVLVRLHPVLAEVAWFGPVTIAIGLTTALAGGVVATLRTDAKQVLAASTSAHHGLMFVAVGAGHPAVAVLHLVAHAAAKSQLFLSAGAAIAVTGTRDLTAMGPSQPRRAAMLAAVGALALAAVPPLGAAWSKEEVVVASRDGGEVVTLLTIVAGGLSALYAARWWLLAYGLGPHRDAAGTPSVERRAITSLAAASVALGLLWVPAIADASVGWLAGPLRRGAGWEQPLSLIAVATGVVVAGRWHRAGRLGSPLPSSVTGAVTDWFGLPRLVGAVVVDPTLRLATALARFDDRAVDGAVRAAAVGGRSASRLLGRGGEWSAEGLVRLVAGGGRRAARRADRVVERVIDAAVTAIAGGAGRAGHHSRRLQTGMTHHYYVLVTAGLLLLLAVAATWR